MSLSSASRNQAKSSSINDLFKIHSSVYQTHTKNCELRSKGLISALYAELKGLSRAFTSRSKLVQSYRVTHIVINLKNKKLQHLNDPNSQAMLETEIQQLES